MQTLVIGVLWSTRVEEIGTRLHDISIRGCLTRVSVGKDCAVRTRLKTHSKSSSFRESNCQRSPRKLLTCCVIACPVFVYWAGPRAVGHLLLPFDIRSPASWCLN